MYIVCFFVKAILSFASHYSRMNDSHDYFMDMLSAFHYCYCYLPVCSQMGQRTC